MFHNQFLTIALAITFCFGFITKASGQTPLNPGIISYNQTIYNNTAPAIFVGTSPTGGNGSYTYQWQQQVNCTGAWSDISGATSANYQAGIITQNMCYRRKVTSLNSVAYSTPVTTNSGLILNYTFDEEPTTNLLMDAGVYNWSLLFDAVATPIIANQRYRINSNPPFIAGGVFRFNIPLSKLVNGQTYTLSYKYKFNSGSTFNMTDWCDGAISNVINTDCGTYKFSSATGTRAVHDGTYRFMDFIIGANTEVEIWDIQLEQRSSSSPRAVVDYSNSGNNGTMDAATSPSWVTTGIKGGAYEFNYGTDRIMLPAAQMPPIAPISFSAWIYSDDITKAQNIISRNGPYFLRITGSTMRYCILTSTTGWSFGNGATTLASNTWYHVCMTYDGANIKGYVNGVEDYSVAKTGALSGGSNFYIGYTPDVGENAPFDGKIDEVRVYNRALTQPDVANLYNSSALKVTVHSTPFAGAPITGTTTICNGSTTTLNTLLPTGGTITSSNGYRIHTFTSTGNFYSPVANNYEVLVVAGGGGGASGGGGGGGLLYNPTVALTAGSTTVATIGSGGTGGVANTGPGRTNGGNSQFSTLVAIGGGAGGPNDNLNGAYSGGSGGGGGSTSTTPTNGGLPTSLQGNNGGMVSATFYPAPYPSAGGGGAGASGNNPVSANTSGDGGIGLPFSISGSSQFYAGGGGGGTWNNGVHGAGGNGGGGAGAWPNGVAGTANTGGGGGGGCGGGSGTGGAGGSGIVIVRYPEGSWSSSNTAVATVSSSGVVAGISGGTSTITYSYTCGSVVSNVSTLVTVNGVFNPGTISENQTLCNSTAPAIYTGTSPTGGDGTYTYQWEQQPNCTGAWSDIVGATTANYQAGALAQNTCYRRKVTNSCGTAYSTQAALAANLVLHYPFNNQQEPTTNLITNTDINSWSWDGSGQGNIGTRALQADGSLLITDNNSNTRTFYYLNTFSANTDYTVSVKFKKDVGTPTFRWQIQGNNSVGTTVTTYWTTGVQQYAQDIAGWQTVSYTFNFTDPTITQCRLWFQDGADYTTYTHSYYLKDPQVEQKNHVTPFASGTRSSVIVSDFSSNGNNGTIALATSPKWIATGIDGGAYDFNGTSNLISTPTINLDGNTAWTVSAWIKTSSSSIQSILSNSSGGPVYNDLKIQNNKITYYHYSNAWLTKQGTSNVADGNWHFLTWVNFANSTMDMYVDGVIEANKIASNLSNPGPVNQIGKNWTSDYFNGSIDDIRIYNTSFTQTEVVNLRTATALTTTVQSLVTAGAIGSTQIICSGNAPGILTSTTAGTGSGTITYEWQSDASGSFVTIGGAIAATYQPPLLISTTSYKRRTVSTLNGNSCYSAYTTAITITVNTPPTAPTSITGTTTVCNGSTTLLSATGGIEGSGCTYEWGTGSTVGLNTILGATSASYTTLALASNTTYWVRRVGATPCSNTTAGTIQLVTVNNPPTAPTSITGTLTICNGTTTILTASGGSEGSSCVYEWGTGSTVGLNTISGATSASYTTSTLLSNTTYWVRRIGNSSCANTTSGVSQLITINTAATAPTSITGNTNIFNGESTILTVSGGLEGTACTYQWYEGSCGNGTSLGSGISITVSPTTNTSYFVRRVSASPCSNTTLCAEVLVNVSTLSITWTGALNTDWNTAGNWNSSTVPSASVHAIIPNVINKPLINQTDVSPAQCNNMTINAGASVTVNSGKALTVNGDLNNLGTLFVKSAATGDGSLIVRGVLSGSGLCNVDRYLTSSKWHLVSAPISNAQSSVFLNMFLRPYDETSNTYGTYITATNTSLTPGTGYICWTNSTATPVFTGLLNNGTVGPIPCTYSGTSLGYTLVGNPYTSAIDWNAASGWTKTNLGASIWIWNGSQYIVWNGATGSGSRYIAMGQGFFIQATSAGSLSMTNAVQVHNSATLLKSAKAEPPVIHAKVTGNNYADEVFIMQAPDALASIDYRYDAKKMMGLAVAPQLYTVKDNHIFSIASISGIDSTTQIPLCLKVGVDGDYTLGLQNSMSLNGLSLLLFDKKTNKTTAVTENFSYTCQAVMTDDSARFTLMFKSADIANALISLSMAQISVWNAGQKLYVFIPKDEKLKKLEIFNLNGHCLMSQNNYTKGPINLNLPSALYIVRICTNMQIASYKIVIQ